MRVKEVDEMHRINLSMRMDPATDKPKAERRGGFGGDRNGGGRSFAPRRDFGGDRGPRRSFGSDRGPRRDFAPRRDGERSSGPHFPTSRFVADRPERNIRGPRKDFNNE